MSTVRVLRPGAPASYAELAGRHRRGRDYEITCRHHAASSVAVIAPHGGGIERGTSDVARSVAGDDFNLYLFEGRLPRGNFEALHLTSHRFDEPEGLALVAGCRHVVAIHGCNAGPGARVLLGGLDAALGARVAAALRGAGVAVDDEGHAYPARRPDNICNRGRGAGGVQLEMTDALRGGPLQPAFVAALRAVLLAVDAQGSAR